MKLLLIFALSLLQLVFGQVPEIKPEQVHLSYGGSPDIMLVTWVTMNNPYTAEVEIATDTSGTGIKTIDGNFTKFTDGGIKRHKVYVCRAAMTGLVPGTTYYYRVGNNGFWSATFHFTALKEPANGYRYAVFGDFGLYNAKSLNRLNNEVDTKNIEMILHVGDMAYDLHDDNGKRADEYFNMIEQLAAHVPYMVLPGNHEETYNFSNYVNRVTMPKSVSNHFYSFDLGPVHFISINTEFYHYIQYGTAQIGRQYDWILHDLIAANQNRANVPWIIVMGHRPMYCSNSDGDDCTKTDTRTRVGMPITHKWGLEKMFNDFGVDLAIWAHEHSYERLWPIYDRKVYNGTDAPYTNPPAMTHIITGSAGCQEDHDGFVNPRPPWSAFRSQDYGYSRMQVYNHTHLYWEQVSDDKDGAIIDKIWLIRDKHEAYSADVQDKTKGYYVPYA